MKILYRFLKNHIANLVVSLFLFIISALLEISIPLTIKSATEVKKINNIVYLVIVLICLAIAVGVVNYISNYVLVKLTNKISIEVQQSTIFNMVNADYAFYEKYDKGEIINRLTKDINVIEQLLMEIYPNFFKSFIYVVAALIVIFSMNTTMAFVSLTVLALYLIAFSIMNKRIIKYYRSNIKKSDNLMEKSSDIINAVKDIKLWHIVDRILGSYRTTQNDYYDSKKELSLIVKISKEIYTLIKTLANVLIIGIGVYFVSKNKISYGTLVAFILFVGSLYNPIVDLFDTANDYNKCIENIKRIFEFENSITECHQDQQNNSFDNIQSIEFKNVSFKYKDEIVLNEISIKLEKGRSYALVGQTGCGKSTLLNILLGVYEPFSGEIFVNNKLCSYREYKNVSLYSYSILQDSYLFNDTLSENILTYNNIENKNIDIVKFKLEKCILSELNDRSSDYIGSNGKILSAGQRQRLLLTRIFNNKKDLVILDECTSALDKGTENKVLKNIFNYYKQAILIFCSHQKQVLDYVDYIITVKEKRIFLEEAKGLFEENNINL